MNFINPASGTFPISQNSSSTASGEPKKYIVENGVTKINPAYTAWKKGTSFSSVPSAPSTPQPLVTFSSLEEIQIAAEQTGQPFNLAPTVLSTMQIIEEDPDIAEAMSLNPQQLKAYQEAIRVKYDIPIGLSNQLLLLSEHKIEFIVDDSFSMDCRSSRNETRWQEAQRNIKEMLEIISSVPTGNMEIRFLNQKNTVISLSREGKDPETFLRESFYAIDEAFHNGTKGSTPVYTNLLNACERQKSTGQPTAIYFLGDGIPNGGDREKEQIFSLLNFRANASTTPFTFIACSNNQNDVEWMNEAEEIAPFCSAMDDYEAEKTEVEGDQGVVFPYSKGIFHVCRLVAALSPDLDGIDEGIPFTKWTLDNLLGIQGTNEEYLAYFEAFCRAQASKSASSPMDDAKKQFPWYHAYPSFLSAINQNDVPEVADYRQRLAATKAHVTPTYEASRLHPPFKV